MKPNYFFIFALSIFFTAIFTVLVKILTKKLDIVDRPGQERKIHLFETPLLGGLAIFLAFFLMLYLVRDGLLSGNLEAGHWLGFFAGAFFLIIGGALDDKYSLRPGQQFIFPLLAVVSLILGGVSIEKITNPLGGFIYLGGWSAALIAAWLLGMMYTTKLLDGVDGLVTGVSGIGALIIFLFTMTTKYYQPDIGLAALVLAGVCFGFLLFNWHPAKIFLGEGGSLLLGYLLGVLAIISGGKIAIALLVLGIPILDVAWTIIRRARAGVNPFRFADRRHLHFRLLDLGLGQKKTVLIYYFFAATFGLSALFLQSIGKVYAFLFLIVLMFLAVIGFAYLDKKNKKA